MLFAFFKKKKKSKSVRVKKGLDILNLATCDDMIYRKTSMMAFISFDRNLITK